jgi:hypothetical protein
MMMPGLVVLWLAMILVVIAANTSMSDRARSSLFLLALVAGILVVLRWRGAL